MSRSKVPLNLRRSARQLARALAFLAILALGLGWSAAPARADGDPASDVLATQPLFLPQDAGIPTKQAAQLSALLEEAQHSGYPIRVALITSPFDLGSVTELWRAPQTYAHFLGVELSLVYRGSLLVVMPDGFGFYGFRRPLADERAAVAGVHPTAHGVALGIAAITAVRRLAAKSGHALSVPGAPTITPTANTGDSTPWIVFAIGAALVAAAWAGSLRARPLRLRGTRTTSA